MNQIETDMLKIIQRLGFLFRKYVMNLIEITGI